MLTHRSGEDVTAWLRQQRSTHIQHYATAPAFACKEVTGEDLLTMSFLKLSDKRYRPSVNGAPAPPGPLLLRIKKLLAKQRPITQFYDGDAIMSVDRAPRLKVLALLGRGGES
jgi:hypothetical protein